MPTILPIRDLRNTSNISELAHQSNEPIFITKNGYSDLVVMSAELYDQIAETNRIDKAIFESEQKQKRTSKSVSLDEAFNSLDEKYFKGL